MSLGAPHDYGCECARCEGRRQRRGGCKHCGGLIICIDGRWEHVSTDNLHPGLPPEPQRVLTADDIERIGNNAVKNGPTINRNPQRFD
jgi:hypothetical protein